MYTKNKFMALCTLGLVMALRLTPSFAQTSIETNIDNLRHELADQISKRGTAIPGYEDSATTLLQNVDQSIKQFRTDLASVETSVELTSSLTDKNKKAEITRIQEAFEKSLRKFSSLDSSLRFSSSIHFSKFAFQGDAWMAFWAPYIVIPLMVFDGTCIERSTHDQYGRHRASSVHMSNRKIRKNNRKVNSWTASDIFKSCKSNACILALSEDISFWILNSYKLGDDFQPQADPTVVFKTKKMISERKLNRIIKQAAESQIKISWDE